MDVDKMKKQIDEAFKREKTGEDYEKPKEYFVIERADKGGLFVKIVHSMAMNPEWIMEDKQIGNYFETEEEAEKAVEKLKAWKRLRDKDFKFTDLRVINFGEDVEIQGSSDTASMAEMWQDLDLLYGGEK